MAGPLLGHARPGRRRDVRHPGRPGARRPRRRGAHRHRHRPAARPRRQGRAAAGQRRRVRRGPRRDRGRRPALPRAARGRPPAAVRPRAVAARAPDRRGRPTTAAASPSTSAGIEEQIARHRPDQPRGACRRRSRAGCSSPSRPPPRRPRWPRLETTLALVEGWVDEVVGQATDERMPAAAKLREAVRRRRAAGGPAEQTFASLVGLELRPRRLRDASTLWGSLRSRQGTEARDARLDAPRPAAHRRRPRRPAGLPRGRSAAATELSRRGLRRRAERAARRGHGPATTTGPAPTTRRRERRSTPTRWRR